VLFRADMHATLRAMPIVVDPPPGLGSPP